MKDLETELKRFGVTKDILTKLTNIRNQVHYIDLNDSEMSICFRSGLFNEIIIERNPCYRLDPKTFEVIETIDAYQVIYFRRKMFQDESSSHRKPSPKKREQEYKMVDLEKIWG